jgi:hypothetical protein
MISALLIALALTSAHAHTAGHAPGQAAIQRAYEGVLRSQFSQLPQARREALLRHWQRPESDLLHLALEDSSELRLAGSLKLIAETANQMAPDQQASLRTDLRSMLERVTEALDTGRARDQRVEQREQVAMRESSRTYREIHRFSEFPVSPDGKLIAIGETQFNTIEIREYLTQKLIRTLELSHRPNRLHFSPDGSRLAVGYYESSFQGFEIFDVRTGRSLLSTSGGPASPIFLTGRGDGKIVEWGARRNRILTVPASLKSKPVAAVPLADLRFTDRILSSDGSWFAGLAEKTRDFHVFSGEGQWRRKFTMQTSTEEALEYRVTPDQKMLLILREDSVEFLSFETGRRLAIAPLGLGEDAGLVSLELDRAGKRLFVSAREGKGAVHAYQIEGTDLVPTLRHLAALEVESPETLLLTPDGRDLLVKSGFAIHLFDLEALEAQGAFGRAN